MPPTRILMPQAPETAPPESVEVRANRYDLVSRLARDLAHEIKNPINSIIINLEVLGQRIRKGEAADALARAEVIGNEIRRVHQLVDQLLLFLRPDKLAATPVAVDAILESISPVLQIQAESARVSFELVGDADLYAAIRPAPFTFALLNLVMRAIDAEESADGEGGRVTLRAHRTASGIDVVVRTEKSALQPAHEYIRFCRVLLEEAGGALASVEPNRDTSGSTATATVPAGGFAESTIIREDH